MIQNLKLFYFENIHMNTQFLYEFFLILDFFAESLKASKNYRKKITHYYRVSVKTPLSGIKVRVL